VCEEQIWGMCEMREEEKELWKSQSRTVAEAASEISLSGSIREPHVADKFPVIFLLPQRHAGITGSALALRQSKLGYAPQKAQPSTHTASLIALSAQAAAKINAAANWPAN